MKKGNVYGLLWSVCCWWVGIVNGMTPTLLPTQSTLSPTLKPTSVPTEQPTDYPVVPIEDGYLIVIEATVPVKELTSDDVISELDYLELLFADASGLDFNEVDIKITSTQEKGIEVLDVCNASIVLDLNYEIISDENTTYTLLRQSLDTESFILNYNSGLSNVFDLKVEICPANASTIIQSYTEEKYDDVYPPEKDPPLTEELWSEYLFFGFITSFLGVVWLWYLRSDVDDDNIYVNKNDDVQGGGGTGIEMQQAQGTTKGSSNALLQDDGAGGDTKLSDYAVKDDDGKLVLDQRDSKRSP